MFEEFKCIELRSDMKVLCNNVETKVIIDTLFDVNEYKGCKEGIICKECNIRRSDVLYDKINLC